jgi:hypothetical protein
MNIFYSRESKDAKPLNPAILDAMDNVHRSLLSGPSRLYSRQDESSKTETPEGCGCLGWVYKVVCWFSFIGENLPRIGIYPHSNYLGKTAEPDRIANKSLDYRVK